MTAWIKGSVAPVLRRFRREITYMAVGLANTGIDALIFFMLVSFTTLGAGACQTVSYLAGVINSFFMNKFLTFRDTKSEKPPFQAARFAAVNLLSLAAGYLLIGLLHDRLGLSQLISKACVTAVTMTINYLGYRLFVFTGGKKG